MITHNDPRNSVRGRETHNNKSNNDNVSLSSQSGEQRQSACARSVAWSTSTPPRPTDCSGASTLPPCTPAGDSSARSTTTTTTTAGMHAESNGLTSRDASMLSTINYVYDTEFKTPGSSCTTLQSDHFVNNNNNGNNYNDNNDDEEDLYTLRRKLKAYWRLYREQERRGRCDIILEQILSLRCILAEEFNARVLLLPSYDVSMAQLEREGVEKLHRLLEETIWGFKRVMRRSLCEQTVEENDSSQFPDALQLTEKKQNIMKKPQHDEEEEMMAARKRTRSEEDYASLCASAGGERWLNKSEYMSCQSYDGCRAAGGGCGGGAADVFPPVYSRAPSYQAETFYDMKNSLNTYHVNRQGEDNMMPCIQQQQQSSSSLLSSLLLLLLSSFPFARIFLFLPLGVFLRCLHLLQKAPELMKLTAFCAVGAVRRSVEGSISFIHEIHEKRTIELLFILTLAATICCCRGCLNAVMFQFYMMFAACLHVISSFISTSKDVMRETTQAMMYSVLSAQMFAYEFFILFPLGCTVRLTHALRSMEKQIISLPHRCGVYASYLVVGAGATVAQKISRRLYPSKRSMNKST